MAAIIIWDALLWLDTGKRNTISEILVNMSAEHPALLVVLGFVLGHLGWPVYRKAKVVYLSDRKKI
jgi:hypothetical protein